MPYVLLDDDPKPQGGGYVLLDDDPKPTKDHNQIAKLVEVSDAEWETAMSGNKPVRLMEVGPMEGKPSAKQASEHLTEWALGGVLVVLLALVAFAIFKLIGRIRRGLRAMIASRVRTFYLVEIRSWKDGTLYPYVRNRQGYTSDFLKKNNIKIEYRTGEAVDLVFGNGCLLTVRQSAFDNLDAAKMHFSNMKKLLVDPRHMHAGEVSLLQVEASSLRSAYTLPPAFYWDRKAVWLEVFMPHLSNSEYRAQQAREAEECSA